MANKVLIITSVPYSPSNRGIDIITEALGEMDDIEVTHLTFTTKRCMKQFSQYDHKVSGVEHLYLQQSSVSYMERLMHAWPSSIVRWINKRSLKKVDFDFVPYDLIIVESGKPVLLLPLLPDSAIIVYRQSDPMRSIFRHPEILLWEDRMMERSDHIIAVRDYMKNGMIPKHATNKTMIIRNGFNIPEGIDRMRKKESSSSLRLRRNAVYLGYFPIDANLVLRISREVPNIQLHIIGECLPASDIRILSGIDNVILYGNLAAEEYIPIMVEADVAIMPFKVSSIQQLMGLNSKYSMAMALGLPVVSRELGYMEEFPKSDFLAFHDDDDLFVQAVERMLQTTNVPVAYNIDLGEFSRKGRISAYRDSFLQILNRNDEDAECSDG